MQSPKAIVMKVVPNDIFHTLTLFAFHCSSFDFRIVLAFHKSSPTIDKAKIPQPWQVQKAFDSWFKDKNCEMFKQLGCVGFECHCLLDDEDLYTYLPKFYMSDEVAFRKSYQNFYENFNPVNYICYQ